MIENVPTADELRTISLRLHFKAWSDIADILTEWDEVSAKSLPEWTPGKGSYYLPPPGSETAEKNAEWVDYIDRSQTDLQGIFTLIQQSQEIGLKSLICEVSPFLLIKRLDAKATDAKLAIWDFTDFPTLDASELLKVYNICCKNILTKEFEQAYDDIRRSRNKISHLGIYKKVLDPSLIIDYLQLQYREFFQDRRWMEDRLGFAAIHRLSEYANKDWTETSTLLRELMYLLPGLSERQFENLIGKKRSEPRFICFECYEEADVDEFNLVSPDTHTAYQVGNSLNLRCIVCDKVFAIKEAPCGDPECDCSFLSAESSSDGACIQCRWTAEEEVDNSS